MWSFDIWLFDGVGFSGCPGAGRGARATAKGAAAGGIVARMMRYDKNKDGKLLKSEVTDQRLRRLFDQADADKDGTLTKEELTAFAAKEQAKSRAGARGGGPGGFGPGGGGPGGDGPPPGFGPPGGGPGGPGMGRPQPGEILPRFLRDRLELSADQEKQIQELQKEVDAKLAKILTDEQKQQLKEMRDARPRRVWRLRAARAGLRAAVRDFHLRHRTSE